MALEIMSSRTLAPYFGSSLFVWGSLIGIVLTGLSLGYYYGGRRADVNPSYATFSSIIFAAGGYTLLTTLGSSSIFSFVLAMNLGERFAPLLVSALLLGPPSICLGMISPYAIRLSTKKITQVGQTTGNLYAISTVGSIIGTFLTAFFLIPEATLTTNLYGVSMVLIATSLVGLPLRRKGVAVVAVSVSLALIMSPPLTMVGVVEQRDTLYHRLVVLDDGVGWIRTLLLDNNFHSAMDLRDPDRIVYLYTGFFHIGMAYNPEVKDVLFIGGGGFSGPKRFLKDYEDISVDVVEIDGDVVEVARQYFSVVPNERLNIYVADGRTYLMGSEKKYDLIILDAYARTYVPFHLMTKEFHELLSRHLSEEGVIISNVITALEGDASNLLRAELKTMMAVYPRVEVYKVSVIAADSFVQNTIVVASKYDQSLTTEELLQNAERRVKVPGIQNMLAQRYTGVIDISQSPILTDDYAPVESLLNPVTGRPYVKVVVNPQNIVVSEIQKTEYLEEVLEFGPTSNGIMIVGLIVGSLILLWGRMREKKFTMMVTSSN